MASVTERTFWIEWMKKQHEEKFLKALEGMSAIEQEKVKAKAKATWARTNDVTTELKQLDKLRAVADDLTDLQTKNTQAQARVQSRVAEKKGLNGSYQSSNFMNERFGAESAALRQAALKKAGIESLDVNGIEAVIMAATTSEQLMKAVEKLAAALGVIVPSV